MENIIARLLFLSSLIMIILSLIYGIAAFSANPLILLIGTVAGLCIMGLAEIVDNVHQINRKLDKSTKDDEIRPDTPRTQD